jgi:hypothetical protein
MVAQVMELAASPARATLLIRFDIRRLDTARKGIINKAAADITIPMKELSGFAWVSKPKTDEINT